MVDIRKFILLALRIFTGFISEDATIHHHMQPDAKPTETKSSASARFQWWAGQVCNAVLSKEMTY